MKYGDLNYVETFRDCIRMKLVKKFSKTIIIINHVRIFGYCRICWNRLMFPHGDIVNLENISLITCFMLIT